ncbi:unnamed protein product [Orchesella dallaii]|uniref:Origin recognition complex subunit 1 n=1 Tax=Orchesella dallaii TaxID=48710 RepID=A0ABP1R6H3_9HEXA
MIASRKSLRTRTPSGTPTTPAEKRLKLQRSVTKSPATPITPGDNPKGVRRSARKRVEKTPLPVVILSQESSEDASPSPVAFTSNRVAANRKSSKSNKTPLKKKISKVVKKTVKNARKMKEDDDGDSEEEDDDYSDDDDEVGEDNVKDKTSRPLRSMKGEASDPRRTGRARKPNSRFGAVIEDFPSSLETTPVNKKSAKKRVEAQSEIEATPPTRVSSRTKSAKKEAESPAPSATRKRGQASVASVGDETPRSSRRKPVKTPANVTSDTPSKSKGESQGVEIQGKKLEWKFNVYGVPKCPLPCRETQFEEIWKFLFENITEKSSGCMYVSGVPGTGKTVIVQAVVDTMKKVNDENKKNLNFKFLYINGLTLASPDKIWKRMFKGLELTSKTKSVSTKEALKRLDSYFESHQRIPVVLVVDELDQILDKQQSILYQLLEWSSHAKNMFSFIAIFNTMSLPEHGLAMRNYSRMGFKRAVFPPYSFEQLHTIVSNMLATFKTARLNTESVSLLSRKVAAISGDARRALEIARRAMEIAESSNSSGIQAVSNAFKEIFSSAKIETIKHTTLLEQLVLKTISDEVRCSGVEEVLTAKVFDTVIPNAVYEGMQWPKDEIMKALMRLAVMRLIIVEDNVPSLHKRVLLKVPVEDVNFALGIHTDMAS